MVSLKQLAAKNLLSEQSELRTEKLQVACQMKKNTIENVNHAVVFKHRRKQPYPSSSFLHLYFVSVGASQEPAENKKTQTSGLRDDQNDAKPRRAPKPKNKDAVVDRRKKTQTCVEVDDHNDRREKRAPKPKKLHAVAVLADDRNDRRARRAPKPKKKGSAAGVVDDCNDRRSQKSPNHKKRNSVAVHHRNSNHQLPIEIVPLPASMLEKITRELKGRGIDEKIVFEKNIMASDIRKGQNRLTMSQDYGDRVLTKSERASLATKAKLAFLIDPNNNIWRLHLNFWPAVRRYALNGGWKNVVDANVMRPGLHRVQLWYFRGERDTLCFALNILER